MMDVVSEAAAIAKAKAFRAQLVESIIASAEILRANSAVEVDDESGSCTGILVALAATAYREFTKEALLWPHVHTCVKMRGKLHEAIYVRTLADRRGFPMEVRLFLIREDCAA